MVTTFNKSEIDETYMEHVRNTSKQVAQSVEYDIDHQVTKYGAQRVDVFGWIAIISEEWGETVQGFLKQDYDSSIAEAKQTIACLSRMITELEREQAGISEIESEFYERPQ